MCARGWFSGTTSGRRSVSPVVGFLFERPPAARQRLPPSLNLHNFPSASSDQAPAQSPRHRTVSEISGSEQESEQPLVLWGILILGNSGYTQRGARERLDQTAGVAIDKVEGFVKRHFS